jgi:hypothetical protein
MAVDFHRGAVQAPPGDVEMLGDAEADFDAEADTEGLADADFDALGDADADFDADTLGDADADFETDGLIETDVVGDPDVEPTPRGLSCSSAYVCPPNVMVKFDGPANGM